MFNFTTIANYHQQISLQKNGCEEAVKFFLQNINSQKKLNAFVEVFADEALQRARHLDSKRSAGEPLGKLHGVVVAIKDVICFKDHKVSAASNILKGFTSLYNSTAVERLLNEDAIIIGNCNCDEFAMGSTNENSAYGNVLNAIDETKVPGGSSGGSAVAVQANLCMVSLGSDTGGSVRQPADFCGIVGMKAGYGRISRHGLIAYASSFDQIGIFGNNIEDVCLTLEVIAGKDDFDSTVSPALVENYAITNSGKKSKIAFFKNALEHPSLDKEIKNKIFALIQKLKDDGWRIEPVEFDLLDYIVPAYYILTTAEASSNLSRYDGVRFGHAETSSENDLTKFYSTTRSKGFGKEVKRRIMLGTFVLSAGYYDAYFTKAQQVRRLILNKTADIFSKYDAIILPTAPSTAFSIGSVNKDPVAMYLADIYTVFANLAGLPAISVPLFKHSNGLPFGLQIMTNSFNEVSLLNISEVFLKKYKEAVSQ